MELSENSVCLLHVTSANFFSFVFKERIGPGSRASLPLAQGLLSAGLAAQILLFMLVTF